VGTGVVIFALTYFGFGKNFLESVGGKVIVSFAATAAALLAILS
jgi:hypothetical protein